MGKLRTLSGREIMTILAQNGFAEVRRRGSHVVMQKRMGETTTTVVVPDHRQIRIGTLTSIVRQSRLPRQLFEG